MAIPSFNDEDASLIRQRYNEIIDIMKDKENVHLGIIKDKAILAHVQGVQKTSTFVLRFNEESDQVHEEIENENKIIKEKQEKENEAVDQITSGGKNLFKAKSDTSAWKNLNLSKPTVPAKVTAKTSSQVNNCQKESKSTAQEEFLMKLNKKSNSPWSKISMPESSMSINDTEKFSSTHPNNKKKNR